MEFELMFDTEGSEGAAAGVAVVLITDPAEVAAMEAAAARAELLDESELLGPGEVFAEPWDEGGFDAWLTGLVAADPDRPRDPAAVIAEAETAPVTGALVAELAAVDPTTLDPSAQVGWMVAWSRVENFAAARKLHGIATVAGPVPEANDTTSGAAFAFAEVGAALHLGDGESTGLVHAARELTTRLPATFAAMDTGDLTWRKARAIVDRVAGLSDEQCAQVEQAVLARAVERAPARHDAAVRRAVDKADPEAAARRRRDRQRDITLIRTHVGDGMAELLARLRSEDAEVVWTGADAWARRAKAAGDARPLDELRVAALVRWAESFLTHGDSSTCDRECSPQDASGGRAAPNRTESPEQATPPRRHGRPITVNVTLDLPTFLGLTAHPGELLGTGTLVPATAIRDLIPDARIRRLIVHPMTGHLLDATPFAVRPTPGLAEFIALRDVEPTTPTAGPTGPATAAGAGDADHIAPRSAGGRTDRDNLHSPSRRWHRAKTLAGWTVGQNDDGTWTWTSPRGRTYRTEPHDYRLGP